MSDIDINAVAASLAETAASLEEHINQRAWEKAEPQILAVQLDTRRRMDEKEREFVFEQQRKDDLISELRRQLNAQVKQNGRLQGEATETRAAIRRVEALKVWTNEDDEKFVFASDLWAALAESSPFGRGVPPAT